MRTTGSLESSGTEFGVGSASHYISNVDCVGNEARLLDCNHEIETQCGSNHIAGAVCTYNGECIALVLRLSCGGEIRVPGTHDLHMCQNFGHRKLIVADCVRKLLDM